MTNETVMKMLNLMTIEQQCKSLKSHGIQAELFRKNSHGHQFEYVILYSKGKIYRFADPDLGRIISQLCHFSQRLLHGVSNE